MMRIVLDTNVLVSAILSPFGAPAGIFNAILSGQLILLYDDRIIAEYREVLNRPKFDFEKNLISDILDFIEVKGERILAIPINVKLPDPFDLPFVEVAITGKASFLITGNKKHFPVKLPNIQILTPSAFLDILSIKL